MHIDAGSSWEQWAECGCEIVTEETLSAIPMGNQLAGESGTSHPDPYRHEGGGAWNMEGQQRAETHDGGHHRGDADSVAVSVVREPALTPRFVCDERGSIGQVQ